MSDTDPFAKVPAEEPVPPDGGGIAATDHDTAPSLHRLERGTLYAFLAAVVVVFMVVGFIVVGGVLISDSNRSARITRQQFAIIQRQNADARCQREAISSQAAITRHDIHLHDDALRALRDAVSQLRGTSGSAASALATLNSKLDSVEAQRAQDDKDRAAHPLQSC